MNRRGIYESTQEVGGKGNISRETRGGGGGRPTPLLYTVSVERGPAERCFARLSRGKSRVISARNIVLGM